MRIWPRANRGSSEEVRMAATISDASPRRNGREGARGVEGVGSDEVARLRAAVQTLADMVIGHGIMDARTLQVLLGDLVEPVLRPVPMAATPATMAAPLPTSAPLPTGAPLSAPL